MRRTILSSSHNPEINYKGNMTKKNKENKIKNPIEEGFEDAVKEEVEGTEETTDEQGEEVLEGTKSEESVAEEILTPEEIGELSQLLEAAQLEAAENMDGWQRAQAEFMNYRKRIERDQVRIYEDATARVIKKTLEVMDDLSLALTNCPKDDTGAEWAAGIELIYRKLLTILENEGVELMEVEGELFDPNLHEAIAQEESPDHESGQIIEVIKNGYLIGERVLRPAVVRVAS
jgi:molecular chaperone GrpE